MDGTSLYSLLPEEKQPRVACDRAGHYQHDRRRRDLKPVRSALIAGIVSTIALVTSVSFTPFALGLLVGILDLIPLAGGATIAAVLVTTVAFLDSTTSGIIILIFFVVYQQVENHILQPVVYGRTVQLSPLVVLIAVLIGAASPG